MANGAIVSNSHPGDGWSYGAQIMQEHIVEKPKKVQNRDVLAVNDEIGSGFATGNVMRLPNLETLWKEQPVKRARI